MFRCTSDVPAYILRNFVMVKPSIILHTALVARLRTSSASAPARRQHRRSFDYALPCAVVSAHGTAQVTIENT